MIIMVVTGTLSACLLSATPSDCVGGIGVSADPSTPAIIALPTALPSILPDPVLPLPLPPVSPITLPSVLAPAPAPVPAPTHVPVPQLPRPVPGPLPFLRPVPTPPAYIAPQPAPPAQYAPPLQVAPAPEPSADVTVSGLIPEITVKEGPKPDEAVPAETVAEDDSKPPFRDGSVEATIGNTVFRFPDLALLLTLLSAVGVTILNEKLDTSPGFRSLGRHSSKRK